MIRTFLRNSFLGALGLTAIYGIAPAQTTLPATLAVSQLAPTNGLNQEHENLKREAEGAYQQGQYQRAVDLTTRVLQANTQDHVAYYLRGSAWVELGIQQKNGKLIRYGITDAREAVKLDGRNHMIYYLPYLYGMTNLTNLEHKDQHALVSIQIADQVLKAGELQSADKANILYQRGLANTALKKYPEAAQDFEGAIQLSSKHLGAHMAIADVWASAGNHEKTVAAYQSAGQAFPTNPLISNNWGMYLQKRGEQTEAIAQFTKALELNSQFTTAYINRGYSLLLGGNRPAAENDLTQALKLDPKQPNVLSLRASSRLMQGNINGAIEDYEQALKLTPASASAHADLGFAWYFAGDYRKSFASFNEATKINPQMNYLDPWRYWCMIWAGQQETARNSFTPYDQEQSRRDTWVGKLMLFSMDKITPQELLNSVDTGSPTLRQAQLCEAHYFIGQRYKAGNQLEQANKHFEESLKTNQPQLSAFRGSQIVLKKYEVTLNAP